MMLQRCLYLILLAPTLAALVPPRRVKLAIGAPFQLYALSHNLSLPATLRIDQRSRYLFCGRSRIEWPDFVLLALILDVMSLTNGKYQL